MKKAVMLIVVVVLLSGCGKNEITGEAVKDVAQARADVQAELSAGPVEVVVKGRLLEPAQVRIKEGTEVVWKKADSSRHRLMENSGVFDSGEKLYDGRLFVHTFGAAGNYEYADVLGGGVGRITVE